MGEIEGRPGELIELLDNDALGERMWYQVGGSAQDAVGGQVLSSELDTGNEPVPGTGPMSCDGTAQNSSRQS